MNAHKTAIARKSLSVPVRWLRDKGLVTSGPDTLDYGCGRGYDCDQMEWAGYDPHFRPSPPTSNYGTVYCGYVFNVVEDVAERAEIFAAITSLLRAGGTAYIAVRNDSKKLQGTTSKGTWQGVVDMADYGCSCIRSTSSYRIYRWEKS